MIREYKKGTSVQLSENFWSKEFDCKCRNPLCEVTLIDDDLVGRLQAIRKKIQRAINIDSGYRCQRYQDQLKKQGWETSTGISSHQYGLAADFWITGCTGEELAKLAEDVGFEAIGVAEWWIHADLRSGKKRRWYYKRDESASKNLTLH